MLQDWQKKVIEQSKRENLQLNTTNNQHSKTKKKNKESENKSEIVINNKQKNGIISMDPSGTSISAIFYYQSPNKWQFFSFQNKDWIKQVEWAESKLKELNSKILLVETGLLFRKYRYDYNMIDLIRMVGALEYQTRQNKTEYERVSNEYRQKWGEVPARQGLVGGLEHKKVKGEKGWPKRAWFFKDKEINEHEKDALLIFYSWWTKRMKYEWPFK